MGLFGGKKVTITGKVKATLNNSLGIPTAAARDNKYLKAYNDFITLYEKMDEKAKEEVLKDIVTMTTFSWTDLLGHIRTSTANVVVAKNNIEVVKRTTTSASHITEAQLLFKSCFDQAKLDYIATGTDIEINAYVAAMERIRQQHKKVLGFASMPIINNSSNFITIIQLITTDKATLQYSAQYEQNQIDAEAANKRNKK